MAATNFANAGGPQSLVNLRLSCRNLPNLDVMSLSDPMIVVLLQDSPDVPFLECGRTECLKDTLNPQFAKSITLPYKFECLQKIRFCVYDVDDPSPQAPLSKHDFIGDIETTLASIIVDRAGMWSGKLLNPQKHGKNTGTVHVFAEEIKGVNDDLCFEIHGKGMDRKDIFGSSDPYLTIVAQAREGIESIVYRSDVIMNTLNPSWKPFLIPVGSLCNGDLERKVLFEVWDWNKRSMHELIGRTELISVRDLTMPDRRSTLQLVNPKKKGKIGKDGKQISAGRLEICRAEIIKNPSFVDFLRGGCEISLIAGVDFTASNGAPSLPSSLHYFNPMSPQPNPYVRALSSVSSILAQYDSDGMFPVYGFGCRIGGTLTHCFPLNGNSSNPEVHGIEGILDVYQRALQSVELYGPTLFKPIIHTSAEIASINTGTQAHQKYFVLLLVTDGAIHDMQATIDEIVLAANSLPLSIVIVGVGNADFTVMHTLDADEAALVSSRGESAHRDIVQFIPFSQYDALPPHKLAEDCLLYTSRRG